MDRLNKRDRGGGGDIRISGGEGWTVETRVSFMLCTHIYTHTDRQTDAHTHQHLCKPGRRGRVMGRFDCNKPRA